MEKKDRLLRIEEVAICVGVSAKTINNWYWFKKSNPDNKLAKLLPDYVQAGERQIRRWHQSDMWKLIDFRSKVPHGRKGVMGSITQKYYHKNKEKQEECQD